MDQPLEGQQLPTTPPHPLPLWRDYLTLCKPRVVLLMLLTALAGMYLATTQPVPHSVLFFGLLGIALAAASAAVINHLVDRHIDAVMNRTRRRPLPTGRITPKHAIRFALLLSLLSMVILLTQVNALTAGLTLLSIVGYAGFYTLYLKRATPQNIVIGGAAGAAPPLLGWTAISGQLDPHALLLVLIIFTWTPPHFWSLALHRYKEYAKADIPMLPVTHGIHFTKLCILLYTALLFPISLLPYVVEMSGIVYLTGACLLGCGFLLQCVRLKRGTGGPRQAIRTFHYSNIYLILLFTLLLVDHAMSLH